MTRPGVTVSVLSLFANLLSCGGSGVDFLDVVGIPPSDGAGIALSGEFATVFEVTSGGCDGIAGIDVPDKGIPQAFDIEIEQDNGTIDFDSIGARLRGGVSFEGEFDVGGAEIEDAGGENDNLQILVSVTGKFEDANSFEGKGTERLIGRIDGEEVDCTFSFDVSGVRK